MSERCETELTESVVAGRFRLCLVPVICCWTLGSARCCLASQSSQLMDVRL